MWELGKSELFCHVNAIKIRALGDASRGGTREVVKLKICT